MPPYTEMKSSSMADDNSVNGLQVVTKLQDDITDDTTLQPSISSSSKFSTDRRDRSDSENIGERRSSARPRRTRIQSMPVGSTGAQDFFCAPPHRVSMHRRSTLTFGVSESEDEGDVREVADEAVIETVKVTTRPPPSPLEEQAKAEVDEKPKAPPSPGLKHVKVDAAGCQCIIL